MLFNKKYSTRTDEELMKLTAKGDRNAFGELYQRYSKRMLNFFHFNLKRDRYKAEDFLQDLFLKIIEKSSSFDAQKKFSTWIYTISVNMCKNEYRKNSIEKSIFSDVQEEVMYIADGYLDLAKQDFIEKELLEKSINELDENRRQIIILRYFEGLQLSEIAEVLGCPLGTVKSSLFNTLKLLSKKLEFSHTKTN
ncbi:MAG: sigma-70 family RNA polymerase sigma factor [bacterium]